MIRLALLSFLLLASPLFAEVPKAADDIRPLLPGSDLPATELKSADGSSTTLKQTLAGKPTVLIFYRGGWCPYCSRHLMELQIVKKRIDKLGYQSIAVSPDQPSAIRKMLDVIDTDLIFLSDANMDLAREMGIAFEVDAKTIDLYKTYNIDLEKASGKSHHQLPVPSVFIVNPEGQIAFSFVHPDYKVRLSGDVVLAAARSMLNKK